MGLRPGSIYAENVLYPYMTLLQVTLRRTHAQGLQGGTT